MTHLGTSVLRREDERLLRGAGGYLDDLDVPGLTHLAVVRSPLAHGRITSIDADEARAAPGVRLVLTASDLEGVLATPRPNADRRVPPRPPLVADTVRMVGDPVAAVVADTAVAARDAAELIWVDYDPLPAVVDPAGALEAPPIYPEYGDNLAFERAGGDPGDVDAAAVRLGDEAVVISGTVDHPRVVPAPLETRGAIASWDGGRLTLHLPTQAPALMLDELEWVLGIDRSAIRIIVPDIGGAFGSKFDLAEEELLTIEAARRVGAPVKWVEGRREHLQAIGHGRGQVHHYRVVADRAGRVHALWVDSLVDVGARKRYITGAPFTPRMGTGNYDIATYAWRQRGAFTTLAPTGIYRGAGRPEATLTIERALDRVAAATGLDPAEVRRRNFATGFPYDTPGGVTYDSGDYEATLDTLLRVADYDGLRAWQAEARAAGRLVGIGLAMFVEATGFEKYENGRVKVEADGAVRAMSGTLDHGQGHYTTFAQVAADELGLTPDRITVVQGDTDLIGYGSGTSGSRSAAHGGSSVRGAAQAVAAKAARIAAHLLEADPADIELADGELRVRGAPGAAVSWEEVAAAAHDPARLPAGEQPGLDEEVRWDSGGLNYPFGAHLAVVEVERETGVPSLLQAWAVDDAGTIINPMIAYGQRHGGMAQGIGQALTEQVHYDADGNLLTSSLMDYVLPAAAQLPRFRLAETYTPSPHNPLGVKGIAEAGAVGIPAAVVNAAVDALAPLGVDHLDLPLRAETLWQLIQQA